MWCKFVTTAQTLQYSTDLLVSGKGTLSYDAIMEDMWLMVQKAWVPLLGTPLSHSTSGQVVHLWCDDYRDWDFLRKSNGIDIAIFWRKCDSITIPYRPRGIGAGHRMGFAPCASDHAECGGVYIFNSKYWGEKIEIKSTSNSL